MYEIEVPHGVTVKLDGKQLHIKGKLGSTVKKLDLRLATFKVEDNKITVGEINNKKLEKKSAHAAQAFSSQIREALNTVNTGIEKRMTVVFAHFPMSIEVKGKEVHIKNIFGEKVPRIAKIIGDTKVAVKGQEITVTGVDKYDVGQTMTNLMHGCHARGQDTRVFQDGIYPNREE